MKKTLLLVFCAAILLCANSAKAQTVGTSSTTTITTDGSGSLGIGGIHPNAGGEWTVTILVTDSKSVPISGALVSAPCTGEGNQYTNSSGTATFSGVGSCPCSQSPVTVITSACDKQAKVSCGTTMIQCP